MHSDNPPVSNPQSDLPDTRWRQRSDTRTVAQAVPRFLARTMAFFRTTLTRRTPVAKLAILTPFTTVTTLTILSIIATIAFTAPAAMAQRPTSVAEQPLPYGQQPLPQLLELSPAEILELDAWIDRIEGGWSGEENQTPMGRMSFAMLFDREADGSLHAHPALNQETWLDFRFIKAETGQWLLQEKAALEGLGERGSLLVPAPAKGALRRWVHPDKPEYLTVDLSVNEDTLFMNVRVLGRDHATFTLNRVPSQDLVEMRRRFVAQAQQTAEEQSIYDKLGGGEIPDEVLLGRGAIATYPDDARAQLKLAQALGAAIEADRSQAPRYAFEMLQSLQKALALDPTIPEVYEWLGGYYLQAPAIAGGSIENAAEMARRLAELDADRGERLLAQVQGKAESER